MSEAQAPKRQPMHPLRVLIKAALLFAAINLVYALIDPSAGLFLVIGRGQYQRFPVLWVPDVHADGGVSLGREMFSNMDMLFAAHTLRRDKAEDEYRVFIFGDSSVWGTALFPAETVAGQINGMHLRTCMGQRVVAYNLGYPSNSATKDLLFMEYAQRYEPDLNLWLFSMLAFQQVRQDVPFVVDNPEAVMALMEQYGLPHDTNELAEVRGSLLERSLVGQRQDLNMLLRLQASTMLVGAMGLDDPRIYGERNVHIWDEPKATEDFFGILPPADLRAHLAFSTLPVATAITGGKIIYVGEPIEIATGEHSDIAYNSTFPRWAYDQFRGIVQEESAAGGWVYLDLWNLIPEEQFTTSIFHLSGDAEAVLAGRLGDMILGAACP